MKRNFPGFLCTFVALLALSASGVAVAQSNNMGNLSVSGDTYTTGIVESFGSDSVTLKLDSGENRTVLLDNATVGKQYLALGSRARIDLVTNDKGQVIAKVIEINVPTQVAPPALETSPVEATRQAPVDTYRAEPIAAAPSTYVAEPATIEADSRTLPATASRLPAVALLGLLALAGGVAFRMAR